MAGHKNEMRSWDNNYHGWWDDAVKGNSALQSGLVTRIYEEVATRNGQPAVFDMEKCYDSVCLCKLIDQALKRNFQKRLLECVNNALPTRLPAPVETRQFVDDPTTMSVANSEGRCHSLNMQRRTGAPRRKKMRGAP